MVSRLTGRGGVRWLETSGLVGTDDGVDASSCEGGGRGVACGGGDGVLGGTVNVGGPFWARVTVVGAESALYHWSVTGSLLKRAPCLSPEA